MRASRSLAAAVALLPAIAAAQLPPGKLVAVLEMRSRLQGADREAIDAAYLSDRVRSAVLEADPSLRVMTRENILVLLEASGRKLEECEGECEVDTGRRLGADLFAAANGTANPLRFELRVDPATLTPSARLQPHLRFAGTFQARSGSSPTAGTLGVGFAWY